MKIINNIKLFALLLISLQSEMHVAQESKIALNAAEQNCQKIKYGSTPLHRATSNDKKNIVRILIDANAHLHIKDIDNSTAEQRASTFKMRTFFKQAKKDAQNMAIFEKQIKKDWR